jgi:hypothetical protein
MSDASDTGSVLGNHAASHPILLRMSYGSSLRNKSRLGGESFSCYLSWWFGRYRVRSVRDAQESVSLRLQGFAALACSTVRRTSAHTARL